MTVIITGNDVHHGIAPFVIAIPAMQINNSNILLYLSDKRKQNTLPELEWSNNILSEQNRTEVY